MDGMRIEPRGNHENDDNVHNAARRRRGKTRTETNDRNAPAAPGTGGNDKLDAKGDSAAAGGAKVEYADKEIVGPAGSSPETAALVAAIKELDRARVHALRQALRIRQAADFFLADYLRALDPGAETSLKARLARAKAAREAVAAGEPVADAIGPLVEQIALDEASAAAYGAIQAAREKEIRRLVRRLPVWTAWAKAQDGLGELGVAVLLGEGGDPRRYANPAKLKKALGLAPLEEYPVGKTGGRKVPRGRKARVLRWVVDSACRQGPYRALYLDWRGKIHDRGAEWRADKAPAKPAADGLALNKHGDLLARFKTGARLICDFWAAWRDAESSAPPAQRIGGAP